MKREVLKMHTYIDNAVLSAIYICIYVFFQRMQSFSLSHT